MRKLRFALCVAGVLGASAMARASTIASLYGAAGGTVTVTGTVEQVIDLYPKTGTVTSNSFTITDGTGSVLAYSIPVATYTATPGDQVTITTTNSPYQGAPELTKTGFSVTVSGNTGAMAPTVITASQLVASGGTYPLAGSYVEIDNVSFPAGTTSLANSTAYHLTDASNPTDVGPTYTTGGLYIPSASSYSAVLNAMAAANADPSIFAAPVDIQGFVSDVNGLLEIEPTSITAAAAPTPEPAALGVIGLVGMTLVGRRRKA